MSLNSVCYYVYSRAAIAKSLVLGRNFANCRKKQSIVKSYFLSHLCRFSMDVAVVVRELERVAPLNLAETWDNVGLLCAPSFSKPISTIIFTNDLTEVVLDEAISQSADMIFSYHPPIFTALKSLKSMKWKDKIILKCIENGIAVYSSHTALDAVQGGVNDWLISCFELSSSVPAKPNSDLAAPLHYQVECSVPVDYKLEIFKAVSGLQLFVKSLTESSSCLKVVVPEASFPELMSLLANHTVSHITVSKCYVPPLLCQGMGRLGTLKTPLLLKEVISIVKNHVHLANMRISFGKHHTLDSEISTVAVCAGSGATILRGVSADLYVTGEMSHHELLDAKHSGVTVILCEHSNSERGFLTKLIKLLKPTLPGLKLVIAETDKDPIEIV